MKAPLTLLLLGSLACSVLHAQNPADDVFFTTLQTELNANMQHLQQQDQKPYFMSYTAIDAESAVISASKGVLEVFYPNDFPSRQLQAQVRIGDLKKDNYKYNGSSWKETSSASTDDHAIENIREAIWEVSTAAYKSAQEQYANVLASEHTTAEREDTSGCFTREVPVRYYEAPLSSSQLRFDEAGWAKRLCEASTVFRQYPDLEDGDASLQWEYERRYVVNSEGTAVAHNRLAMRVILSVSARTSDGIPMSLMTDYFTYSPDSLPTVERMQTDARDLAERIIALVNAPVAEPFTGPAILSGQASGVFFHEIFGHRLESHRLKEGGETFRKMVGEMVLPKEFNVYCDPTLRRLGRQDLNGYYLYDDEGVKARRVDNVVGGRLREFLVSRTPMDGFEQSNGHGRASFGNDAVSRQSNLVVETSRPYTEAQLRRMLIKEAKRQHKEYGYYIRSVSGGYTMTGDNSFLDLNVFSVQPIEAYRVYVDGRPDELVRCVEMIGTPLSMFSNIAAAGNQTCTFTGVCGAESGWVPVTASSPMLYVTKIETQRTGNSERTPVTPLAKLALTDQPSDGSDSDAIIWSALRDEMQRTLDSLSVEGQRPPFLTAFQLGSQRTFSLSSSLGGLYSGSKDQDGGQQLRVKTLVGDYKLLGQSSDYEGLPHNPDYSTIRRKLAEATHTAYRQALQTYASKMSTLERKPRRAADAAIPDLTPAEACDYSLGGPDTVTWDIDQLQAMANRLSAIFLDYPQLRSTSVSIRGGVVTMYSLTSEQQKIKRVTPIFCISASASVRTDLGKEVSDGYTLYGSTLADITDEAQIASQLRVLAERLMSEQKAIVNDDYYRGPLMMEGEITASSLLSELDSQYINAQSAFSSQRDEEWYDNDGDYISTEDKVLGMIGQRIIDPRLSLYHYAHMPAYKGIALAGNYDVDEDGIVPDSVLILIDHGILRQQLASRYPGRKSPRSTGTNMNNQLGSTPDSRILHLTADETMPLAQMKQQLIRMATEQGKPYAYILRRPLGFSMTQLLRVDLKTGEETPVHTGETTGIDVINKLYHVDYLSTEEQVVNRQQSSVICPAAAIFDNMEVVGKEPKPAIPEPIPHPTAGK